jgi:hypothetical protein
VAEVSEIWRNDRYVAIVRRREDGDVASLSIRREDRKAIHDWRHLQLVKNDIAGPEAEAFELYPAESRLVDTSNQYWLWCMPPGEQIPIGFSARAVQDEADPRFPAARQRPLPATRLTWHKGTHQDWREHDGHRRHAHSRNGVLTIDPHDTRVHFAGGIPFDNPGEADAPGT